MASSREEMQVEDDGLACAEVGSWAEEKYRLVSLYDKLFATGMKKKWDQRVYIDLYAGAGHSKIRDTNVRLKGSPVLALNVPNPFDQYIFCEEDETLLAALKERTTKVTPAANITFVPGSCDAEIEKICRAIPKGSSGNKVLSLCFVDPFDFGLKFETIRRLSKVFVDFLVLLAVGMDANRAYEHYVDGNNTKLDEALGNSEWRKRWKAHPRRRDEFLSFLADEFALSMTSLGYLKIRPGDMKMVRSDDKNLPLYYLALFSRHKMAYQFWDQVLEYGTDQKSFAWE
ncbi:MAG: three-Cys-motif partner protein TcmP [Terracidiphilus sp.]|jgi:three-Cys-motif partner protein